MMKKRKRIFLVLFILFLIMVSFLSIINLFKEKSKKEGNAADENLENIEKAKDTNETVNNFIKGKVTKHIDGDTVHVTTDNGDILKVRMIGVDTPETVHSTKSVEFYGKEASEFTKSIIYNKTVYLEKDVSDVDRYGRALRYIWLKEPNKIDQKNIETDMFNALLVINGYANASTYPPDIKYQKHFTKFEREAREKNVGLWDEDKLVEFEKNKNYHKLDYGKAQSSTGSASSSTKDDIEEKYVGNASSKKFHYASCKHVKRMSKHNKLYYDSRDEFINDGYVPCKACNP